jgi:hypothetical protein
VADIVKTKTFVKQKTPSSRCISLHTSTRCLIFWAVFLSLQTQPHENSQCTSIIIIIIKKSLPHLKTIKTLDQQLHTLHCNSSSSSSSSSSSALIMASKLAFTSASPRLHTTPIKRPLIPISSVVSSLSSSARVQSVQFNGRHVCLRRRVLLLSTKATADQQGVHLNF